MPITIHSRLGPWNAERSLSYYIVNSYNLRPLWQLLSLLFGMVTMVVNLYFFPSNAFLRRRRRKALLRVNDRGGGWRTCILALCRVSVCVCVRVCARMS